MELKRPLNNGDYPVLFKAADKASGRAQSLYFNLLRAYLCLLVVSALVAFYWSVTEYGTLVTAALFLITLSILVWLRFTKPEDTWYNGRAVAESVKTRSWRWMMKAEPFQDGISEEESRKRFIADLRDILEQNRSISKELAWNSSYGQAISPAMESVRSLPVTERVNFYLTYRIEDQQAWYSSKAGLARRRTRNWFIAAVLIHSAAVLLLLYRIKYPATVFPTAALATGAGGVLTWLQAKKYNEQASSYSLAAHEIALLKSDSTSVTTEEDLSDFVVDSEAAFSREHTQWAARKNE